MAWLLTAQTVGHYTTTFTLLDGDPLKLAVLDRYVDVGINPPGPMQAPICGRPMDTTHLPTRARPSGRRRKLADIVGCQIGFLVSDALREIVEHFDPGVHAFHPIRMEWKTGAPEDGHYLWVIQRAIKGLHPDLIHPPYTGPMDFWNGLHPRLFPDGKAVFSAAAIGDAHAWSDPQLGYRLILSDALSDAFVAAGLTGYARQLHIPVV